jgi:tetratricopeptide (TPR) repeat protein
MSDLKENKREKIHENGFLDKDETIDFVDTQPVKSHPLAEQKEAATNVDVEKITNIILHLENPAVRARLAEMVAEEMDAVQQRQPIWKRFGPWLASASSALIMVLAFFIPSVEDQWDRYQARQVIRLDPGNAAAQISLGNLFRAQNKLKEAKEAYRASISIDDKDSYAYYDLGLVLSDMKRAQEAEDAFRKAVQNAPDDTDLLRALAQQLDANGKKAEAEQLLSDVKRIETAKPEKTTPNS